MNDENKKKEDKKEDKIDKRDRKRWYRLERIKALTAKAAAVATKRKWLVFLIGIGLAAYFLISRGGGGGLGGLLEMIKGLF